MSSKTSTWRSEHDRDRYVQLYDRVVADRWPVPHEEIDVPTSYGTTRVRRSGCRQGTPVVMVHPTAGSSAGWYPVIGALSAQHDVYTPDTVGTPGRSTQSTPITSGGQLVEWLDQVLDGLDLDTVHLLGYSEGGWIAGLHASLTGKPTRIASLVLIEPSGAITAVSKRFLAGMVRRGAPVLVSREKPAAVRRFNQWMNGDVELTDEQVELLLAAMGNFRQRLPRAKMLTDAQLADIAAPTLLVMAADSRLCDATAGARRARDYLRDVEIDVVPDAGHGVLFQHPERTTGRVLDFLRAHTPAGHELDTDIPSPHPTGTAT